jgi:hypothetical protein
LGAFKIIVSHVLVDFRHSLLVTADVPLVSCFMGNFFFDPITVDLLNDVADAILVL